MKHPNDTMENRTRDLPACNTVPQSTAPQRAPANYSSDFNFCEAFYLFGSSKELRLITVNSFEQRANSIFRIVLREWLATLCRWRGPTVRRTDM